MWLEDYRNFYVLLNVYKCLDIQWPLIKSLKLLHVTNK